MGTMESCEELMGSNEEKIYVSVRLRPLDGKEIMRNELSDWDCINDNTIVYKNLGLSSAERSMYPTVYTFDRVFSSRCSTREVYEKAAKDVAISVVDGVNSSVFAYGQTSSGKTYTMTGVTEYAIADIYEYIHKHPEREFVLRFSALEIYNESVRDLLSADNTPLRLLDDPERGTTVERLTEVTLMDWNHVIQLLSVCEAQRQIGETSLNETSSRSHQIIRLTIESSSRELLSRDNASTLNATVNFVDLAGSERASQTLSAGTRLKEGCHINRSLLTLGTVIRKLSKGRNGHIPYRDSKLTRILQTSLGGNARTAIICTMSPARCHVEQSRNTLLFASCAKEVTTNAQVNVVMSDKALVKYLQREITRLESELRSCSQSITTVPSDYSAILRHKDHQIEQLEKKNKDLMLQRDVAQSQVRDLLQLLGDNASPITPVRTGNYPQLRVRGLPESRIPEQETSIGADPESLDVDTRAYLNGHSRSSSEDHFAKVPYYEENFIPNNIPPRVLVNSSNLSESDSYHNWDEAEKQSNATSEDLCREVRCIETEDTTYEERDEPTSLSDEGNSGFDRVNENLENVELSSPPVVVNQEYSSSSYLRIDGKVKKDLVSGTVDQEEEPVSASLEQDDELPSVMCTNEMGYSSKRFLDTPSVQKPIFSYDLDDSSGARNSRLTRSMSCRASIITDSASSLFRTMESEESIPSERDPIGFEKKVSPWSVTSKGQKMLSRKDSESSQGNALDIGIDIPNSKSEAAKDVIISSTANISEAELRGEKVESQNDEEVIKIPAKESETNANESLKKIVKNVGLDPISDELRNSLSWPVKFKRLQREIIQLWHDCNASLVHRTYFFLLFQGDPSDAIYLEVELRRMNFLKNKLINGGKTIVDDRLLTANSSAKALRRERQMLSKQMRKKLSEQERESLYLKWNIGLNTKLRRMQLSRRIWSKPEDMNHVSDSAFLVAKLVGFVETGQEAPNKEMFGLNFTPTHPTRASSFRRSFTYLL